MATLSIEELMKLYDQSARGNAPDEEKRRRRTIELMAANQAGQPNFPPTSRNRLPLDGGLNTPLTPGGAPPTTGLEYPGGVPPTAGLPPVVPPAGPPNTPNFLQRLAQSPFGQSIQNIDPAQFMELLRGTGGNTAVAALGSFQAAQKKASRDRQIVGIQEKYGKLLSVPNLTPEKRKQIGIDAAFELARYAPSEKAMENIFEAFSKLTGFKESDAQEKLDLITQQTKTSAARELDIKEQTRMRSVPAPGTPAKPTLGEKLNAEQEELLALKEKSETGVGLTDNELKKAKHFKAKYKKQLETGDWPDFVSIKDRAKANKGLSGKKGGGVGKTLRFDAQGNRIP